MYPFYFSILFCPDGWPVGRDWLLPGVTPIQVQAHQLNRHQPLVSLPTRPPAIPAGLGAHSATAGSCSCRLSCRLLPACWGATTAAPAGGAASAAQAAGVVAAPPASSMPASSSGVVPASSWSTNQRFTILVWCNR
jgi:hypothetical protein